MSMLIQRILEAAAAISLEDTPKPSVLKNEMPEGAEVIGVVPDDLKKLYLHLANVVANLNSKNGEFDVLYPTPETFVQGGEEAERRELELDGLENEYCLTKECFWRCLGDVFPKVYHMRITILDDWSVAIKECEPEPELPDLMLMTYSQGGDLLDQIFGGGHGGNAGHGGRGHGGGHHGSGRGSHDGGRRTHGGQDHHGSGRGGH